MMQKGVKMSNGMVVFFLITALGYLLKQIRFFNNEDAFRISRAVVYITLPSVIVNAIMSTKLEPQLLLISVAGFVSSLVLLSIGFAYFLKLKAPKEVRGSLSLTLSGVNMTVFAYPFAELAWGNKGVTYMSMFSLGNALVVFTLGYLVAVYYSSGNFSFSFSIKKVLTSPIIIALVVSSILNFSNISLPTCLSNTFETIGRANTPLSMIAIGAYLDFKTVFKRLRYIVYAVALKYVVGFIIGIILYAILRFLLPSDPLSSKVVLIGAVMPSAIMSLMFSAEKKLDPEVASGMITATVSISSVILFIIAGKA